ncbi:putative F-box/LRR-repeat protein At3g28410 [Beta vulgaris subsp. vulgaris]|uniref:putative F-box/LRR-repeat protein At3g28410 n=1 Tax=Beta vulgaris subsp. vulgaris TaxID=3555 RepID=UPI00053F98F2|nr:putative F-box/LRR-repeat protein At3g28410 [Beta vulgaris subsp. vulgaris]
MEDQLSKLPDSVLIHILSFLPTFDAVYRAGLVSKRLRSLRHSLPSLVFANNHIPSYEGSKYIHEKLSRYINDLLIFQGRHNNLRKCCFHLPYNCPRDYEIDAWIKLALNRKVKELELFIPDNRYCLPRFLFRNEILTSLSVTYAGFTVIKEMNINWKSLKSLSMKHIKNLDDDMLGKILIGCPILELLELNSCTGIKKLDVVSQSLKELVLHECTYVFGRNQHGEILRVSAPSLQVLVISGSNRYDKCILENFSSLVEAQSVKCWPFLFSNCHTLTLDINLKQWELPGLAIMLQNCPKLENLIINMTEKRCIQMNSKSCNIDYQEKNFWMSNPNYVTLNCLLEHIKVVKIIGLQPRKGGELMVEFLQFILKHARVLERLFVDIINVKDDMEDAGKCIFELSVFHMLLSFPRSSESAVIVVNCSKCNNRKGSS